MNFKERCLNIVASITDVKAYFIEETLFVITTDSKIAVRVFNALTDNNRSFCVIFGKVGDATSYEFV